MKRCNVLGTIMLYPNVVRFYPEAVSQGLFALPIGGQIMVNGVLITRCA